MAIDYAENLVQLLAVLSALLICLFQYIRQKENIWIYATAIYLSSLLSCYYWTAYLIIMDDWPTISNLFSYSGWNLSYIILLMLVLYTKSREEKRYFHPFMLLPIPLNLWQLSLYLPYGGAVNSIYQVTILTLVACFSVQSFCWYFKNRKAGAARPYVASAALLYVAAEFGMWTSSCFYQPIADLYYPCSFIFSSALLLLVLAVSKTSTLYGKAPVNHIDSKYQTILICSYIAATFICCAGGILLGSWMRTVMEAGLDNPSENNIYNIIPVILFVISLFMVVFAIIIIFIVNVSQKAVENNQLREATEVAESSNEAKSEFLAHMSNEIRTPINTVLGMNEMILKTSRDAADTMTQEDEKTRRDFDDINERAGNIEKAGNTLLSMINDILDYSRIEEGKLEIVNSAYRLRSVLGDVIKINGLRAEDKGLSFQVDVDEDLPDRLYGDEFRVRQIFNGLLSNAVKYTDKGTIKLTVSGRKAEHAHPGDTITLNITVADTGIGIKQEDIEKLFSKFGKIDIQNDSSIEGAGLGLPFTKKLLDLMGGTIDVSSVYREGSVFTVTLPQKIISAEPVGKISVSSPASRSEGRSAGSSVSSSASSSESSSADSLADSRSGREAASMLEHRTVKNADTQAEEQLVAADEQRAQNEERHAAADGESSQVLTPAQPAAASVEDTGYTDSFSMDSDGTAKKSRISLLVPVIIILLLMVGMVIYTSRAIQRVSVANIQEVGEDKIAGVAAELENYLEMTKSVLWVTADTVDHMSKSGASSDEILDYITEETEKQEKQFDKNYTGIYGYVNGDYLDGAGWTPPDGYDPTERDWYKSALKAEGETTIVSPYVDAQTNGVIISISRMLSNGKDVLSLDVTMNHIQDIVADLNIKDKGYGYILNQDGMIIAHPDESKKGTFITDTLEGSSFLNTIQSTLNGSFQIRTDEKDYTVFVHEIMEQWYVVIVVGNRELYSEVWRQLAVNVLICIVIFVLIAFFYFLGHRNEQAYSRRIEEMRAEEQRQIFESKALKLEKDAADQANQAKSNFLAEMSHEIRTPINAVLGMNEMIIREIGQAKEAPPQSPEEIQQEFSNIYTYARDIEGAGNSLLSIINDILDLSKIEAGRMELVEGNYKLSTVLNDLSNMIFFKAKEKGLSFVIDVDETLPDVLYGDEVRVRQIFTNILNNAVKYTEHGSVCLTVSGDMHGSAEPGQTIRLKASVKDTGIGIREEDIDKLFTKFQRLDLKENSTVEGTGLGLAITHTLLSMMGGSISVESEYGKGSVFTVIIPQRIVSADQVGDLQTRLQTDLQKEKTYKESFHAPDARILVVDDTLLNLTVVTGLLKHTKLQIDTASNGARAIELTNTTAYDLILLDQRMPKMDGIETLHRIRAQKDNPNHSIPVICLTADAVIGARERYMAEGFSDYLTKPIAGRALEQMLLTYLPEEKVESGSEPGESAAGGSETDGSETGGQFAQLRSAGIDPDTGLGYCQDDDELYKSVLHDYAEGFDEKVTQIRQFYDSGDWDDYCILVHAVKSSSRMIGAAALADIALRLEKATDGKQRQNDTVDDNGRLNDTVDDELRQSISTDHLDMLRLYQATVTAIKEYLGIGEKAGVSGGSDTSDASGAFGTSGSSSGDDEILEFMPEDNE